MAFIPSEHFEEAGEFRSGNGIQVKKYKSIGSGLCVYFCDIESQVINGYFAFGTDEPEACGIETLLWQLDSSGGLLPRAMRGDMLRPAWQFHGAENPLSDRDQSCYVCCALGETAFLGTFSCCVYLLQNIEAVFDLRGFFSGEGGSGLGEEENGGEDSEGADQEKSLELGAADREPKLNGREFYCLSEAGEGAMAWEATLQEIFKGVTPFWNRLLFEGKNRLSQKMRDCYDNLYRPENLTVVITGSVQARSHILETLSEFEADYYNAKPTPPPAFIRPWSSPLPPFRPGVETTVKFIPRNLTRAPTATLCFGWRGCPATDVRTHYALKVLTAYASVGPLWNKLITPSVAQRISWCMLEYADTCALVTIHGAESLENVELIVATVKETFEEMAAEDSMKLDEIQAMVERVGWHCVREMESDPALALASSITKAERYGGGGGGGVEVDLALRLDPIPVFEELRAFGVEYWRGLVSKWFIENGVFVTRVLPRSFDGPVEEITAPPPPTEESSAAAAKSERSFSEVSRRTSSRPRSRANAVGAEGCWVETVKPEVVKGDPVTEVEKSIQSMSLQSGAAAVEVAKGDGDVGHIERIYEADPGQFPFGDYSEAAADFEERLGTTSMFLDQVMQSSFRNYPIAQYSSEGPTQHPKFDLTELPFCTFLDDTPCSFLYLTSVMDTSHLSPYERRFVPIISSVLGAILCPRPPELDTDAEIASPNEFNPPLLISDSQVSLGLNGEMMQNIFSTLITRPCHYKWAVGMMHFVMYEHKSTERFLTFVASEAAKGLAYNYRMQNAEEPNYECFDSTEINLYSLIKMVYKDESNARLFVGRRRLDLINWFLAMMKERPEETTKDLDGVWRKIVDHGRLSFQIACDVDGIGEDPVGVWREWFGGLVGERAVGSDRQPLPTLDKQLLNEPSSSSGLSIRVKSTRPATLTLAIPIDPTATDFPALCVSMQLFSMAQKWIWQCMDEEDCGSPSFRMPCSFANIVTLNLESSDVVGALKIMRRIVREDWEWLNSLLTATKLMLVNDPTANEMGPQGAIAVTLLTSLARQPLEGRRDLTPSCIKVTLEQVKSVIRTQLSSLFDPARSWYALTAEEEEAPKIEERLGAEFGMKFECQDLQLLCLNL